MYPVKELIEARKIRVEAADIYRQVQVEVDKVKKKEEFFKNERKALQDWARRLKYAQLKITKHLREKQIDKEIEGIAELISDGMGES